MEDSGTASRSGGPQSDNTESDIAEYVPSAPPLRAERTIVRRETAPTPVFRPTPVAFPAVRHRSRRSRGTWISFLLLVVMPFAAACAYYYAYASNRYVAEFRFFVYLSSPPGAGSTSSGTSGGILNLSQVQSPPTITQSFVLADYLKSGRAAQEIDKRLQIRDRFSRPEIDWWWRYHGRSSESLAKYWQTMVDAQYDMNTGLAYAKIQAFTPTDAQLIASELLKIAEDLANDMSLRARNDIVSVAQREVDSAEERLKTVNQNFNAFRNTHQMISSEGATSSNVQLVNSLRQSLSQIDTQLKALSPNLSPKAPAVVFLRNLRSATEQQLRDVEKEVKSNTTDPGLSTVVAEFEDLTLRRTLAQQVLTNAVNSLEQAKLSAASQMIYVMPYVVPTVAAEAVLPNRPMSLFIVFLILVAAWAIVVTVTYAVLDHIV